MLLILRTNRKIVHHNIAKTCRGQSFLPRSSNSKKLKTFKLWYFAHLITENCVDHVREYHEVFFTCFGSLFTFLALVSGKKLFGQHLVNNQPDNHTTS